jgi:hypothetical protein
MKNYSGVLDKEKELKKCLEDSIDSNKQATKNNNLFKK